MKKHNVIFWAVTSSFIGIGLILLGIGFLIGINKVPYIDKNGFHVQEVSKIMIKKSDFNIANLSGMNIDIDVDLSEVEFIQSDKYGIELCYPEKGNVVYAFDGFTFKVTGSDNNGFVFFTFPVFNKEGPYVRIYMPKETTFSDVKIKAALGDVKVNGFSSESLTINCNLGEVKLADIKSDELNVDMDMGDFIGRNLELTSFKYVNNLGAAKFSNVFADALDCKVSKGNVVFNECTFKSLMVDSSLGDIKGDISSEYTDIKSSYGDIELKGTFKGKTTIITKLGDVELSNEISETEYGYDLKTNLGDIKVNDQREGNKALKSSDSKNFITIKNSNGNIDMEFEK